MAFEGLTEKLQGALRKLSSKGKLTEENVKEGMREVRMALLEADVNYAVAKDFIKKVTARCVGTEITGTLSADALPARRPAGRGQTPDGTPARHPPGKAGQEADARRVRHLPPRRHQAAAGRRQAGHCAGV